MQDYHDLKIWQRSHALALATFRVTARMPRRGHSKLISQIRGAAGSVPATIVEGCERGTNADFARFLDMSVASAGELEYHLELAHGLHLIGTPAFMRLVDEIKQIKRMTVALIARVRGDDGKGGKDGKNGNTT